MLDGLELLVDEVGHHRRDQQPVRVVRHAQCPAIPEPDDRGDVQDQELNPEQPEKESHECPYWSSAVSSRRASGKSGWSFNAFWNASRLRTRSPLPASASPR